MANKILAILFFTILLFSVPSFANSGSMKLLAVSNSEINEEGSLADLYLEIKEGSGRVFMDSFPLSRIDTQISTRFAKEVACNFLERDCSGYDFFYTIRANSPIVGGPSAGAATTVLTIAVLEGLELDSSATITGTINTGGIIGPVGGILPKISAANSAGIKKVIIPKYTRTNESNLTEAEEKYGVDVIEVSKLSEAVKEMTGKEYPAPADVEINKEYLGTMIGISDELCKRSESLLNTEDNSTARSLLEKGKSSLEEGEYYSAASYCFGSGLNSRYAQLQNQKLTDEQIKQKIDETSERVSEFKNLTNKKELRTITDLEAFMVVTDRLIESKDRLSDAMFYLAVNNTNSSIYHLAYGIERLSSAHSWSVFFGKPGKGYNLDKKSLQESCLSKISEVEERIQYLQLYLPTGLEEVSAAVKKSYDDYNQGYPELCLYKASIAKARVNSVLNSISIEQEDLGNVISDRSQIVKSIISKQAERGVFPILAYSYYEYANSLKESDPYSSLLYLEYAMELGNLEVYFEKKKIDLPKMSSPTGVFLTGFSLGAVFGMLTVAFIFVQRAGKKKSRQP